VADLKTSGGTAPVPSCGDPSAIASVRNAILEVDRDEWRQSSGETDPTDMLKWAKFDTVWVHPAFSGRFVCSAYVTVDVPGTKASQFEFETYAENGQTKVFFYDKTAANQQ
jgi:hypothetical protein